MSWADGNWNWPAVSPGPLAVPVLALVPYVLLALALVGMLAMYFALKREMATQTKRNRRMEAMLLRLRETASAGAQCVAPAGRGRAAEDGLNPLADGPTGLARSEGAHTEVRVWGPAAARPGMNLSRRVQALRLLRRGEDLGHIASALGVPLCEVALLVRVQRFSVAAASADRASPVGQISGLAEISAGPPVARGGPP